jgi:inosine-uridine nucleoside N-ribohydrolase
MEYPLLSEQTRLQRLKLPQGKINVVIDTDTFNEIDDQFAVVHALLSSDRLDVKAINAAPFFNDRSKSAYDGMLKSYDEILKLLDILDINSRDLVHKGSKEFLNDKNKPYESDAVTNLIDLSSTSTESAPLFVVSIGAITNIASAILIQPEIVGRIVIVWLAGNSLYWPTTAEFNLRQDIMSSRTILDCGVPLIQIPCLNVASHLILSIADIEKYVQEKGKVGDYLAAIFKDFVMRKGSLSKVMWDISATALLVDEDWVQTEIVHSPILTERLTWSIDKSRHFIRCATEVNRDAIFTDLYEKLERNC